MHFKFSFASEQIMKLVIESKTDNLDSSSLFQMKCNPWIHLVQQIQVHDHKPQLWHLNGQTV